MKTPQALVLNNIGGGMSILVERLPHPNETVMMKGMEPPDEDLAKGGNVAVALARMGVRVAIIGKIGTDVPGKRDWAWLENAGVDMSVLLRSDEVATGQGIGILADNGDVMHITGVSSSRALTEGEVEDALNLYKDAIFFITGFEVRKALSLASAQRAKKHGMVTVLNPSPVPSDGLAPVSYIDYMFVNEVEGQMLLGLEIKETFDPKGICAALMSRYCPGCVVLTMGHRGSAFMKKDGEFEAIDPVQAKSIDSSGAGDGYMAAVVARLIAGESLSDACRYASGYAAYSVTKKSCLAGYPTQEQLDEFLSAVAG
jgi:ribokinase